MGKLTLPVVVRDQLRRLPAPTKYDLAGRVIIVTGSNVGLGLEAARHFATMRPLKLILAVRSVGKGEAAKRSIVESTGCSGDSVEVWELDMANFESVRKFARRAQEDLGRLDILLANAGLAPPSPEWTSTQDGFEITLEVNAINTGLLALLLLPLSKRTAALPTPPSSPNLTPHITIVGSELHFWAAFKMHADPHPITALNDKAKYDAMDRYPTTKLLNLFLARKIATLAGEDVIVNVTNPGLCHSQLFRSMTGIQAVLLSLFKALLARSTEVGSRNLVWASLEETPAGAYVSACQVWEPSDFVLSTEGFSAEERCWADFKVIWEKVSPEVASIME